VIDDDPVSLAVSRAALESRGHEVLTLERALGAVAVILREQPDVVVLDLEMPGLSGDAWLHMLRERRLLERDQKLAVILHSGAKSGDLERIVLETGALGGIPKQGNPLTFASDFERLVEKLPG